MPDYTLDAPCCGVQLTPHAGHHEAAPWFCAQCHRGFWAAELTPAARSLYRPLFHDWGLSLESAVLREAVDREREEARRRGTSALPEHLGQLEPAHLDALLVRDLRPDFARLVSAALPQKTTRPRKRGR